jgi:hypothetical protein
MLAIELRKFKIHRVLRYEPKIYSKLAIIYMEQVIFVLEATSKTWLGPFTPKIGRTNKYNCDNFYDMGLYFP